MALKFDAVAKESGAVRAASEVASEAASQAPLTRAQLVASACGGDSVPADLGTAFAERQFGEGALVNRSVWVCRGRDGCG